MLGGHRCRWYPLRVVGTGRNNAPKACDIRLRLHFIPALQHPATGLLSFEGPPARPNTELDKNPDAEFLTVVLEEGRHLSHPDLLVGPFELFAEVSVDYQLGNARENEAPYGPGACRTKRTAMRSEL